MPYTLSEEEALIQKTVREFARDHIGLETAAELDRHDRFPVTELQAAASLGLTAMTAPADVGGSGITATAFALAIHEIAQVCPNTAAVLSVQNGSAIRALLHAEPTLRTGLLAKAAAGELFAFLAAEESHGSETRAFGTQAVRHDDGFRLTGEKVWGVAAAGAKHLLVMAHVPDDGPTLLYVPADTQGVTLGRNEPLLGLRASGIRTVHLANVHVPEDHVIGTVGNGLAIQDATRPWLQVAAAAALAGCIAGGLERAATFAAERVQFGRAIGHYQAVSDGLTTIDTQLAASRALTLEAAARLDAGDDKAGALHAARAKLFAAEIAGPMTRQSIRVQAGTGFMREGGTERFARDARVLWFLGETPHMQRDALKRAIVDIEYADTP